ncbi:hypothetical protein V8C26DRAFT_399690 [Trichoderma gracile]
MTCTFCPLPPLSSSFCLHLCIILSPQRHCDRLFLSLLLYPHCFVDCVACSPWRLAPSTLNHACSCIAARCRPRKQQQHTACDRSESFRTRFQPAPGSSLCISSTAQTTAALCLFSPYFFLTTENAAQQLITHRLGWRILGQLRVTGKLACLCFSVSEMLDGQSAPGKSTGLAVDPRLVASPIRPPFYERYPQSTP